MISASYELLNNCVWAQMLKKIKGQLWSQKIQSCVEFFLSIFVYVFILGQSSGASGSSMHAIYDTIK